MGSCEKWKLLLWKIFRCPASWLVFFWCLLAFVFLPLLDHPEKLYPLLPVPLYDAWEEFAVLRLEEFITATGVFFFLFALAWGLVTPLSRKARGWRKAGITLLYLLLAFFWLTFALPMQGRARDRARRISCNSNLRQIYIELEVYAGDNAGFLPPELAALNTQGYLTDREVFRCPSRRRPNPEFSDYLYFGKGRTLKEPFYLLLCDRDGNHPGGRWNNLFSDGRIRWETEDAGFCKSAP